MIFISQLSRVGLGTKQSRASILPQEGDRQPGQNSNMEIYQGPAQMENVQSKKVQTFIPKGKQYDLENDGIQLTFEMHDPVSQAHRPDQESAPSLKHVDTNDDGLWIEQSPST